MSARPVLILQLQRLGDIILTFPLLGDLARAYPASPVWMVAEEIFYRDLSPLLPGVRFLPPASLPRLLGGEYEAVFNFSSRDEAAILTAQARSASRFGPLLDNSSRHVAGFWQLYRMALTGNNRHNVFHWSDLNRLDLALPRWTGRQPAPVGKGRIGLFIGASETAKRPDAAFWAALAIRLGQAGFTPVLLGGPAEREEGAAIAARAGITGPNFCGNTSIAQLCGLLAKLDLLITPDTGPMHLADWLGCRVLNLSMGNVNGAETGPSSPGQWVLRAPMSCVGCWDCQRPRLYCHTRFKSANVARVACAIMAGEAAPAVDGLELLRTDRDENGLFRLKSLAPAHAGRQLLDDFWQAAFLSFHDPSFRGSMEAAAAGLGAGRPALARAMSANFGAMIATLAKIRRSGQPLRPEFWQAQPLHSRLFAGHVHMSLQNAGYTPQAWAQILERLASLGEVFSPFI